MPFRGIKSTKLFSTKVLGEVLFQCLGNSSSRADAEEMIVAVTIRITEEVVSNMHSKVSISHHLIRKGIRIIIRILMHLAIVELEEDFKLFKEEVLDWDEILDYHNV